MTRAGTGPVAGGEPFHDDKGEMCILHRTTLKSEKGSAGFVMVSCRPGCPDRRLRRERR